MSQRKKLKDQTVLASQKQNVVIEHKRDCSGNETLKLPLTIELLKRLIHGASKNKCVPTRLMKLNAIDIILSQKEFRVRLSPNVPAIIGGAQPRPSELIELKKILNSSKFLSKSEQTTRTNALSVSKQLLKLSTITWDPSVESLVKRSVEREMHFGRRLEIEIVHVEELDDVLHWIETEYRRAEETFYNMTGFTVIEYANDLMLMEDNNETK